VLVQTKNDISELKLKTSIVGHIGDGNFHTFISLDVNDDSEMKNYHEYTNRLIRHSLKCNGSITGEHGVGLGKNNFCHLNINIIINIVQ
jgi:D-lactate dehydrogenase (cytochrome)